MIRSGAAAQFAPHGLRGLRLVDAPRLTQGLNQPETAPGGRLLGESANGRSSERPAVSDRNPDVRIVLGDAQRECRTGVNDGVGRQLADHLLDRPAVAARAPSFKSSARKPTRVGDTARRGVELTVNLIHARDPTNGAASQNLLFY